MTAQGCDQSIDFWHENWKCYNTITILGAWYCKLTGPMNMYYGPIISIKKLLNIWRNLGSDDTILSFYNIPPTQLSWD